MGTLGDAVTQAGEQRKRPHVTAGTDGTAVLTWLASNGSTSAYYSGGSIDLDLAYAGDNVWLSSPGTKIDSSPTIESTTFSVVGDGAKLEAAWSGYGALFR